MNSKRSNTTKILVYIVTGVIVIAAIFIILILRPNRDDPGGINTVTAPLEITNVQATNTKEPEMPQPDTGSIMIRQKDGMEMVYIPQGEFVMGVETKQSMEICRSYGGSCSSEWFLSNSFVHKVTLDSFWIDKTEVTNGMYKICVEEGRCDEPGNLSSETRPYYYLSTEFSNYPVVYVSWENARKYCSWAGGRLPTEAEWEKAARGTDQRIYPWGNDLPNYEIANTWDPQEHKGDTETVGKYPANSSPYGALDMSGNVWEWVSDYFGDDYYANSPSLNPIGPETGTQKVVRGGTWHFTWDILATTRNGLNPDTAINQLGFRCAKSSE